MLDLYADFGITPGNITRSTFQAAVDAAQGIGLYITPNASKYNPIEQIELPDNTVIRGLGKLSTLQTADDAFFLLGESKNGIDIQELSLEGDSAVVGGKGSQSLIALRGCTDSYVGKNHFRGGARAVNIGDDNLTVSEGVTVENNWMYDIADTAIFLIRADSCRVKGNRIKQVGNGGTTDFGVGITLDDASGTQTPIRSTNLIISENYIFDVIGNEDSRGMSVSGTENSMIINNIFRRCGATGSTGMPGLRIWKGSQSPYYTCRNLTVSGNHFYDIADDAIIVAFSSEIKIHDNYIRNFGCNSTSTSRTGIQITTETVDSSIHDNTIVAGPNSQYGTYHSSSSATGNSIYDNKIDRNGNSTFVPYHVGGSAASLINRGSNGQFSN